MATRQRCVYDRREIMSNPTSSLRRFGRGMKAAVQSLGKVPVHYVAGGVQVRCAHCGGYEFDLREILMNTRGVTFLNLDWLNRGASALTCRHCSRIEWFAQPPEALD